MVPEIEMYRGTINTSQIEDEDVLIARLVASLEIKT